MKDLVQSKVVFDELSHTYTLNNKQLSGITSILSKFLFPKKYDGISEQILNAAKEKGSLIHNEIHLALEGFEPSNPTTEYKVFKQMTNMDFIASEYLVSDNENFASAIDLVDKDYNLFDIKTTYKLDKDYVSWQLSIYAYLFELQNPGLKANELYGIHLRGNKGKFVKVDRKPDEEVKRLLDCAVKDIPFVTDIAVEKTTALSQMYEVEQFITNLESQLKELKETKEKLNKVLLDEMNSKGITKFENDNLTITKKEAYTRQSIDSKKLQEENPEVYNMYLKETKVKESIIIKLK